MCKLEVAREEKQHSLLLVWLKAQNLHNHAKFPVQPETYFIRGTIQLRSGRCTVYRRSGADLCDTMMMSMS